MNEKEPREIDTEHAKKRSLEFTSASSIAFVAGSAATYFAFTAESVPSAAFLGITAGACALAGIGLSALAVEYRHQSQKTNDI